MASLQMSYFCDGRSFVQAKQRHVANTSYGQKQFFVASRIALDAIGFYKD
jgi:hypothetical protein